MSLWSGTVCSCATSSLAGTQSPATPGWTAGSYSGPPQVSKPPYFHSPSWGALICHQACLRVCQRQGLCAVGLFPSISHFRKRSQTLNTRPHKQRGATLLEATEAQRMLSTRRATRGQ